MSKRRKKWWGYVKAVIRDYPCMDTAEERQAVDEAIRTTWALPDGRDRLRLIGWVYWKKNNLRTVDGAAMMIPCCERTARQWHGDFIREVAKYLKLQ